MDDGGCNKCHDPLALHGGTRRDVKLCVLCHSTQTKDRRRETSSTAVFFHKLHGDRASWQAVHHLGQLGSIDDCSTRRIRRTSGTARPATSRMPPQKRRSRIVWYTNPSRLACGSCHDTVDFAGDEPPGAVGRHAVRHLPRPDSGVEFDASVKGAHTIPLKSKQLKGLTVEIVSATNVAPDKTPTIVFKITNTDGTAVDGIELNDLRARSSADRRRATVVRPRREQSRSAGVFDAATGTTTYTFAKIPA